MTAAEIPHRGGRTFGYRVERGRCCGRLSAGSPARRPGRAALPHSELGRGVDLLIHDAQFVSTRRRSRDPPGHATIDEAVAFAVEAEAREVMLFHHSPSRTDVELKEIVAEASPARRSRSGWPTKGPRTTRRHRVSRDVTPGEPSGCLSPERARPTRGEQPLRNIRLDRIVVQGGSAGNAVPHRSHRGRLMGHVLGQAPGRAGPSHRAVGPRARGRARHGRAASQSAVPRRRRSARVARCHRRSGRGADPGRRRRQRRSDPTHPAGLRRPHHTAGPRPDGGDRLQGDRGRNACRPPSRILVDMGVPADRVVALSGPSFAREVAGAAPHRRGRGRGRPAAHAGRS